MNLNSKTQRLCAWSGFIGVMLFFAGFLLSGFVPPPGPSMTPAEVAAMYQGNMNGIRLGMVIMMAAGAFMPPQVAVIALHMRRIEKGNPLLTYTQLAAGAIAILFIIIPAVLFIVAAFRPERPEEITYLLNDLAWTLIIIVWPPFFTQIVALGLAIVQDKSASPVFPRWLGFFNFWVALLLLPASLIPWFRTGPFAWNGVFAFWIPGAAFFLWFLTMLVQLLKVIDTQERESTGQS